MPISYTPNAANNPATITMPADLDDASAESVNLALRQISDRGAHVYQLAALLAQANVFTAAPQEVSVNDANLAALITRKTADDDAISGNKYKAVLSHNIGGGVGYVNIYAGTKLGEAQYIVVINAVWDTDNQRWGADNTTEDSLALLFDQDSGIRVSRRPAGAGTWTAWPSGAGHIIAGDHLEAGGDCNVGNDVNCVHAVNASSFNFTTPTTTLFPVSVFGAIGVDDGAGAGFTLNYDASGLPYLKGSGGGHIIEVPFKIPVGGTFSKAEIMADVTGDLVGFIYKRSGYNWSSPGLPTETQLGGTMGVIGHGGGLAVYGTGTFTETVSRSAEYRFQFTASSTVKIYGFRVTCAEPGPRN